MSCTSWQISSSLFNFHTQYAARFSPCLREGVCLCEFTLFRHAFPLFAVVAVVAAAINMQPLPTLGAQCSSTCRSPSIVFLCIFPSLLTISLPSPSPSLWGNNCCSVLHALSPSCRLPPSWARKLLLRAPILLLPAEVTTYPLPASLLAGPTGPPGLPGLAFRPLRLGRGHCLTWSLVNVLCRSIKRS